MKYRNGGRERQSFSAWHFCWVIKVKSFISQKDLKFVLGELVAGGIKLKECPQNLTENKSHSMFYIAEENLG